MSNISQTSIDLLEQKLLSVLHESQTALEQSDKITFGNTYVKNMKTNCYNINRHTAEALILLGHLRGK